MIVKVAWKIILLRHLLKSKRTDRGIFLGPAMPKGVVIHIGFCRQLVLGDKARRAFYIHKREEQGYNNCEGGMEKNSSNSIVSVEEDIWGHFSWACHAQGCGNSHRFLSSARLGG